MTRQCRNGVYFQLDLDAYDRAANYLEKLGVEELEKIYTRRLAWRILILASMLSAGGACLWQVL